MASDDAPSEALRAPVARSRRAGGERAGAGRELAVVRDELGRAVGGRRRAVRELAEAGAHGFRDDAHAPRVVGERGAVVGERPGVRRRARQRIVRG